ncbi:MAG: FHA domain-containing protein [Hyphomicrobiaceae bacterium]
MAGGIGVGLVSTARAVTRVARLLRLAVLLCAAVALAGFDVQKVEDSVVRVFASGQGRLSTGSGFVVSGGTVVITNNHVVAGRNNIFVGMLEKGVPFSTPARLVYADPSRDLAVLRTERRIPGSIAKIADYEPKKGAELVALGFPGYADEKFPREAFEGRFSKKMFDATLTKGTVSRFLDSYGNRTGRVIQHTTTINRGNSGGPLFDACGNVVGVNTFGKLDSQGRELVPGIYFSMHSSEVLAVLRRTGLEADQVVKSCDPKPIVLAAPPPAPAPAPKMTLMYALSGAALFIAMISTMTALIAYRRKPELIRVPLSRLSESASRLLRRPGSEKVPAPRRAQLDDRAIEKRALPLKSADVAPTDALKQLVLEPRSPGFDPIRIEFDRFASGRRLLVGRGSGSDVVVADPSVSSRHAELSLDERGSVHVADLQSSNGTWGDDGRVTRAVLSNGQTLRFGKIAYTVRLGGTLDNRAAAQTWVLEGSDEAGRRHRLKLVATGEATWIIGRESPPADLLVENANVSKQHARLRYRPGSGLEIADLGSTNGTRVDGESVGSGYRSLARARRVQVAGVVLELKQG